MKNMRIPTRPAPSIEEARRKTSNFDKKKRPPRPPPPNFNKVKSKSAWNLNQENTISLIEWSPPTSPKTTNRFGGSVSSSFSSSTSSLASSKKSFEYESVPFNQNPWNNNVPFPFPNYGLQAKSSVQQTVKQVPTIIRPQPSKKPARPPNPDLLMSASSSRDVSPCLGFSSSLPMPNVPPPSPPKIVEEIIDPFGIALFDYDSAHGDDLHLQENDIVYLTRKVNEEWFYGRVDDREGMFPASFIDIQVPLPDPNAVTAVYDFNPQLPTDLKFKAGDTIKITGRVSEGWLLGECNGKIGQFPSNFIDKLPTNF